jgi:hypothetical protein
MCVLFEPGERIDTVGYGIFACMFAALLVGLLLPIAVNWRKRYLDIDCGWCGCPFYSSDLPRIRQSGCCPSCGRSVPPEGLVEVVE